MDTSSYGEEHIVQKLPWLRRENPDIQIILASACLCFNPGFYNALVLLGAGGGQASSADMANIANGVLYGVFAFVAIGAGSILNKIGPRITLLIGCSGYPIFSGAMWYFTRFGHLWFPVVAGAYLGIAAGFLWTTAVSMAVGYPEEKEKGRWRAVQWCCNMGGSAIGASVALGISWNSDTTEVPRSVYIVFIILQCCSAAFALLVISPAKLIRCDGTAVAYFQPLSIRESLNITGNLFKEWRILIMLPCMFVPEMFYPFQATLNAYAFNLRTRTLNSLLFTLVQLPISGLMAWMLDTQRVKSRKTRLQLAIIFCAIWLTGVYIAQTIWLDSWDFNWSTSGPEIDCTDSAYAGAVIIYVLYAAQYGMTQSVVLYTLSTFTNDPRKITAIGGVYVGVLSAGTAISFGVCASLVPFQNINGALFALTTVSWPVLYFVSYKYSTDTNYGTEDSVIVPIHVQQGMKYDEIAMNQQDSDRTADAGVRDTIK